MPNTSAVCHVYHNIISYHIRSVKCFVLKSHDFFHFSLIQDLVFYGNAPLFIPTYSSHPSDKLSKGIYDVSPDFCCFLYQPIFFSQSATFKYVVLVCEPEFSQLYKLKFIWQICLSTIIILHKLKYYLLEGNCSQNPFRIQNVLNASSITAISDR